ncbi:MAG TPA: phage tail sheath protein [Cyanobacteria bacterium UBA8543]|nr:phage tail sheath protein [Cyanobacteria bacterium UBA8543]
MTDILPGVSITVKAEGLIVAGPISTGNIGIVGTAKQGTDLEVVRLSSYDEAQEKFGTYDAFDPDKTIEDFTLVRALEIAYANGASSVYAVKVAGTSDTQYAEGLEKLANENVQIVVAAGKDYGIGNELNTHVNNASTDKFKRERIAVVGSKLNASVDDVKAHNLNNDDGRIIVVSPGIKFTDAAAKNAEGKLEPKDVILPAAYTAAAVAGLLSTREPHISLTNKTLSVPGLEKKYNPAELEDLITAGVLALEERRGFRVVRAITTNFNVGAFGPITTIRIVDYAKNGVRSAAEPYIGLLNNDRVRKALKGSINGFLARMVDDEMLTLYKLDVTATRDDEKQGIAKVIMTLQPTFSIEFIKVVMFLE